MNQPIKQVVYTPVDVEDGDFVDFERDEKMESENAEFEAFKSEMHDSQDDAKITVGKKLTDSRGRPMGRQTFECFECGIDDYTFSQLCTRIRDDFGTGLYQIQGRDSKGKYKFRKTVGILAPNTPDNAPAGNDVGSLIDKFSDAMERQQMRTEQMFQNLTPQSQSTSIKETVEMMTALMGAMNQNNQPVKTMLEQLTEFKLLKELMSDGSDGSGGEANLYSLLGDTVKAFGVPIAAALAAGADSGQLDERGVVATPALPAPKDETMETQTDASVEMRKNIHVLIQNAKAGIDPAQFALILVNNTPAEKEDALWEFISAEDCIDQIIFIEPVAAQYKQWFIELRSEVIDLMTEPDLPEDLDIPDHPDDAKPVGDTDLITGEPLTSEDLQFGPKANILALDTTSDASVAGAENADNSHIAPDESTDDSHAASDTDRGSGDQSDA